MEQILMLMLNFDSACMPQLVWQATRSIIQKIIPTGPRSIENQLSSQGTGSAEEEKKGMKSFSQ